MSLIDVKRSAEAGRLVVVLGAGATSALMLPEKTGRSWIQLIQSGLDYSRERGYINDGQAVRQREALTSNDMDELLGVAEFVSRKLQAPDGVPYARWLQSVFKGLKPPAGAMKNAIRAIAHQKILIATLNFDTVAEVAIDAPAISLNDKDRVLSWCRRDCEGILHLHGVWTHPETCVFGIRDYNLVLHDEVRDLLQRSLSSLNRLLFIGCGETLGDPNFSTLICWLRKHVGAAAPHHYALVRDGDVDQRLADPAWQGFVEPISYGAEYSDLPSFLLTCFPTRLRAGNRVSKAKESSDRHQRIIESYRSFLIRDCGEMTIEGMRADMDTAQRKFDLEKLFVPLELQPVPPIFPLNDADRDVKLQTWEDKNGDALPFSKAFSKHKRIALLALPGGGKTLLLKRLAVAYCNVKRREASPDGLPALEILPVMIRCREWKDRIRKPLRTLLQEISDITGDRSLDGLADALQKPLKAGSVLLLVDGLDEVHDDGDRASFVENLERFMDENPGTRLLVTSREAGFDLVAPCVARFCIKFKIAPLKAGAIRELSGHWHRLMSGGSAAAMNEANSVATTLLEREPLRRLAENPLLLTMLLVVKHGAGRLPPDRVSLYNRAVEVLLDTWNIKGHEALNTKEAVPQLACLAFELMRQGAQTATEREILEILAKARAQLPTVGRYAKDSPHDFLKRVELRSSLMLEGGHTSEGGFAVPFYQFRHLTFQEYLAAVAAVEGYFLGAGDTTSPVEAIGENLLAEEWKEVVPMAAVLARNQAGPLLEALTLAAEQEVALTSGSKISQSTTKDYQMVPATSRLAQAMAEEAFFPPSVLHRAARLVAYFSDGLSIRDSLKVLGRGPYGDDLRSAALSNYLEKNYKWISTARNTLALLECYSQDQDYWISPLSVEKILYGFSSLTEAAAIKTMAAIGGSFRIYRERAAPAQSIKIYDELERVLFDQRPQVYVLAAWIWGFWRHLQTPQDKVAPVPVPNTLRRLASLFIEGYFISDSRISVAIAELEGVGRNSCQLDLSPDQVSSFRKIFDSINSAHSERRLPEDLLATLRIAFLLPELYSDDCLRSLVEAVQPKLLDERRARDVLIYLGIEIVKPRRRTPKRSGHVA